MKYLKIAKEYYYYFHQHPELSFEEFNTTNYIKKELEKLKLYTIDTSTKTGLIATINPNCNKVIALRADIDALPIIEETKLEYKSLNHGVMHACGHDFHTANLLAFAHYLVTTPLNCTIKLIFQHAEELTPGGSHDFISNGSLNDVDHFFGLHVDPSYQVGQIIIKEGPLYASCDDFDISIIGQGGHISTPHLCNDPLICANSIISDINNVVTRKITALEPPVIGVSSFNYGDGSFNIINDKVSIKGSIRALSEETREQCIAGLNNLVKSYTKAYQLDHNIIWYHGDSVLNNDIHLTRKIIPYLQEHISNDRIVLIDQASYGAEDFASYARLKPSIYFLIGAYVNKYDFHNSRFEIDENSLEYGLLLFKNIVAYFNKEE